jgi:hypothetical protein
VSADAGASREAVIDDYRGSVVARAVLDPDKSGFDRSLIPPKTGKGDSRVL